MDYIISAPGYGIVITSASGVADARRIAREMLAVRKLPKGTEVERYIEEDWN